MTSMSIVLFQLLLVVQLSSKAQLFKLQMFRTCQTALFLKRNNQKYSPTYLSHVSQARYTVKWGFRVGKSNHTLHELQLHLFMGVMVHRSVFSKPAMLSRSESKIILAQLWTFYLTLTNNFFVNHIIVLWVIISCKKTLAIPKTLCVFYYVCLKKIHTWPYLHDLYCTELVESKYVYSSALHMSLFEVLYYLKKL